ncbi:MAG: hypothetical protein ABEH35_01325 [Haloarculaceae archaeon]
MSREELATASDLLESAAGETDDEASSERLTELAGQLETLAERDRGPDHGRLARIENALGELRESAGTAAVDDIDEAHEQIKAYRSGVEGV